MVEERINERWPNQPYEIIEYTKIIKPFTIKCLSCGRITTYSNFNNFFTKKKKGLCICKYSENNNQKKHLDNEKRILEIIKEKDNLTFISFQKRKLTEKPEVTCYCSKCKQEFTKTFSDFLKYPKCFYCESRERMNEKSFQILLPKDFEIIGPFESMLKKIKIRHKKCGFIWNTKPKNFMGNPHCPKCEGKRSKGELSISKILSEKKISYEMEKSFSWQSNKRRRYDFYLPDYNLVIEYMGQQHYFETNFFKISYEEQKKIDKEKKEEAIKNGKEYLAIGYFDFDKIEDILNCWFNDYSKRK